MSMPPPPEAYGWFDISGSAKVGYVEPQMREYGVLCRKMALEEAAKVCAAVCSERDSAFANGYNQGALDCETRIKELK